eukprot:scaffold256_cov261-Pinguiococcus_pyrenoidosus.AAC.13
MLLMPPPETKPDVPGVAPGCSFIRATTSNPATTLPKHVSASVVSFACEPGPGDVEGRASWSPREAQCVLRDVVVKEEEEGDRLTSASFLLLEPPSYEKRLIELREPHLKVRVVRVILLEGHRQALHGLSSKNHRLLHMMRIPMESSPSVGHQGSRPMWRALSSDGGICATRHS